MGDKPNMTREEFLSKYWRYYLMLEKKFIVSINYVELDKKNYSTFSIEYAHLLQAICGELDTFFKQYCDFDFDDSNKKGIKDYAKKILNDYPEITKKVIVVSNRDIEFIPFENWNQENAGESLKWWQEYNNVKHKRIQHMEEASLENVLYSLGALFLLEMKYLKNIADGTQDIDIPDEETSIFYLKDWVYRYGKMGDWHCPIVDGEMVLGGGSY